MKPKYNMTQKENIFLAKRNIVDYIWKSANLEGIGVTYPDTQAIYNGMAVSGYSIDDINAINDLKHAWYFLLEHINDALDLNYIKQVHRQLGKFTVINAGSLRYDEVRIGGTDWIPPIPDEKSVNIGILDIVSDSRDVMDKALDITLYIMRSQLFYDGNKRIAMLIGNKIMIENGLGIITVGQKYIQDFYKLLISYYESNDKSEIKDFLYKYCIDGMNFTKSKGQ
jgi:Fic family protein